MDPLEEVVRICEEGKADLSHYMISIYQLRRRWKDSEGKTRADGVDFTPAAKKQIKESQS